MKKTPLGKQKICSLLLHTMKQDDTDPRDLPKIQPVARGQYAFCHEVKSGYQVVDAESRDIKEAIWLDMLRTYGENHKNTIRLPC